MTNTGLERWGRLLLHAYPPEYRQRRGAEIVATLLDTARPGQRLPAAADAADVVRAGLRERLAAGAPDPTSVLAAAGRPPVGETMRAGLFTSGVRSGAAATLALSLAWLVPATVPYVMSWAPQLAVLLAGLVVATVIRPEPTSGVSGPGVGTVDRRSQ